MLSSVEAEGLALEFIATDLEIPEEDRDWFDAIDTRLIQNGSGWYVVEIGIAGLPDKWIVQVYDRGECDPCYTFLSPLNIDAQIDDLAEFPESIAQAIAQERQNRLVGVNK